MAVLSPYLAFAQQELGAPPEKGSYVRNCAVCHGDEGKCDGPYAPGLKLKPADLTQLAKKNNGAFPSARVTRTLDGSEEIPGHGTRQKPVWGHQFGAGEEAAGGNAAPTVARAHPANSWSSEACAGVSFTRTASAFFQKAQEGPALFPSLP
jgi:hypothetical protein